MMQPTDAPDREAKSSSAWRERRASVRRLCNRDTMSRQQGASRAAGWLATVRDLSADGIGLMLYCKYAPGTILCIEPVSRGRCRTLLARVIYAQSEGSGWLHGCDLANALSEVELEQWLA